MSDLMIQPYAAIPLPAARVAIAIRPGTLADVPFMDALQRKTTQQVGFMPRAQFEGKVKAGHVLIAEVAEGLPIVDRQSPNETCEGTTPSATQSAIGNRKSAIGYLIAADRYFKRDDVGVIYQINVVPDYRRHLVAAQLLRAQFDRSAYGCRLYCCWCAQDIAANRFWESMGFVPLAFRAGSRAKDRVHIFWQKKVRGAHDAWPWWYPSQTTGGSLREDRIVLPIPPGLNWSDEMPRLLPQSQLQLEAGQAVVTPSSIATPPIATPSIAPSSIAPQPAADERGGLAPAAGMTDAAGPRVVEPRRRSRGVQTGPPPMNVVPATPKPTAFRLIGGGLRFGPPPVATSTMVEPAPKPAEKPKRPARAKAKNDPAHVSAARELRDRYLDQINTDGNAIAAPAAKYDVARLIRGPIGEAA